MITLAKVDSTTITDKQREIKVLQFGAKTADECAPFGEDSNPLKDMIAVYAETAEVGEPVIIGYLNENQLAAVGEKRLYSLKPDGSLSFYTWLRNNGTMELGGNAHNLVRYEPLNNALQSLVNKINAELVKIQTGLTAVGGVYAPAPVSVDVSASKINEIKSL
jgi:hypothetical protein